EQQYHLVALSALATNVLHLSADDYIYLQCFLIHVKLLVP
ncbi:unnamed protein product, partial [marine sediment metagenome]